MEIKEIGSFYSDNSKNNLAFFSDEYFVDANLLLVRISEIISDFEEYFSLEDGAEIPNKTASQITRYLEGKVEKLNEFYAHGGKTVVIVDQYPILFLIKVENYTYSDYIVDFIDILSASRIDFSTTPDTGDSISFDPLASELIEYFNANFYFTFSKIDKDAIAIGTTKKSKLTISLLTSITNGQLLILPEIEFRQQNLPLAEKRKRFLSMVKQTMSAFQQDLSAVLLNGPQWSSAISFSKQDQISLEIASLEEVIREEQAKLLSHQEKFRHYEVMRSICFTKGKHLELGVITCLEHLGIECVIPEGANTDLVIRYQERIYAVEIKGSNGSAAKSHTRQLEEWVNRCAQEYNVEEVKGVLIINCFHDQPITDRTERHFPENVIEFSVPRHHCLMTTIKLLELIAAFDRGEKSKADILDLLLDTSGVLDYQNPLHPFVIDAQKCRL